MVRISARKVFVIVAWTSLSPDTPTVCQTRRCVYPETLPFWVLLVQVCFAMETTCQSVGKSSSGRSLASNLESTAMLASSEDESVYHEDVAKRH